MIALKRKGYEVCLKQHSAWMRLLHAVFTLLGSDFRVLRVSSAAFRRLLELSVLELRHLARVKYTSLSLISSQ